VGRSVKVKVTVNIDQAIYEKSHSLGINVSKACENYLKILNQTIEATNNKNNALLAPDSSGRSGMAGGEGFEPSTPNLGGADFWNNFRKHLKEKKYLGGYDTTLFNYAQLYGECLFKGDLSKVRDLSEGLRPNVLKALSALAKFTGRGDEFPKLMKKFGVTWPGRSNDDIFIDRVFEKKDKNGELVEIDPDATWNWIKAVKQTRPGLTNLLDLMAVSGLRFVEGVNSCNLIVKLSQEGKLSSYYAADKDTLEHFRFKEIFLRNTKKAFVSFVPPELIKKICVATPLTTDSVKKLIQKRKLPLCFGDIREAQGTLMIRYLKEDEINFIHGRISGSVFMSNYFNPSQIADLHERVFQGINEILEKIKV
jgi:intergrase/recombinase